MWPLFFGRFDFQNATCFFDFPPTRKLGRQTSDSSLTRSAPWKEELRRMFKARSGKLLIMSAATLAWAPACLERWTELLWSFFWRNPCYNIGHGSHDYHIFWMINQLWLHPCVTPEWAKKQRAPHSTLSFQGLGFCGEWQMERDHKE